MSQFSSELITIEQLFLNNDGSKDKGKNFFIPIYQRDYVWDIKDIEKFVSDIFSMTEEKNSSNYNEYFIGGIVLCRESVLGEKRSELSLEVIDGQQRLTTISIILSYLFQYLKFRNKDFGSNESYVETFRDTIYNLLKYKMKNNITRDVIDMYKVERSDDIADLYSNIIDNLLSGQIEDFTFLLKNDENNENNENSLKYKQKENFINLVNQINGLFSGYNEDQLVEFTIQLLEYTKVVVTKTEDINTGFLVFEKLNDNGKRLNPDNLLKNYLFSKASRDEYIQLEGDWKIFLDEIHNINHRGTKVTPREFLENYLIIKGKKVNKDKNVIFKIFKDEIYTEGKYSSLDLVDELKKTVVEYASLKRDEIISKYLNLLGFKLGYLLFLSLYKKLNNSSYKENKYKIFIDIFRFGFCYIITDNSKLLSQKIPDICKNINDHKQSDENSVISYFNKLINDSLEPLKDEFKDVLINSNLFDRRKNLTITLLSMLNFYLNKNRYYENSLKLAQIIPMPKKLSEFNISQIENLTFDNITKYSKLLGNLTLIKYDVELDVESISLRQSQLKNVQNLFLLPSIAHTNLLLKSKEEIENRSIEFYKIAYIILFDDKLSIEYFFNKNIDYYFLERSESKNALMIIEGDKCFKVKKGSRCNLDHHDSWSYTKLKEDLINENIIKQEANYYVFEKDFCFDSPSAAASIILGKQAPGPLDWKNIDGISLKDL